MAIKNQPRTKDGQYLSLKHGLTKHAEQRTFVRGQAQKAPHTPGVYFFKNKAGAIIYIGKARNLRMRLASYFRPDAPEARKRAMIKEAAKLEWKETDSDIEALILESELIKKNRPKYNILMRDDKKYFYVGFSREKFPKIFITHQPQNIRHPKLGVLGPFTDGGAIKTTLKMLRPLFPYCQCPSSKSTKHNRPCQNAELGRCLGVCCLKEEKWKKYYSDAGERKIAYAKNITAIKKILSGGIKKVKTALEKEMKRAAKDRDYEKAAQVRNQLLALENIFKHKPYLSRDDQTWKEKGLKYLADILGVKKIERLEMFDVSNIQGKMAVGSMAVFVNGQPDKNEYRKFKIRLLERQDDTAMIREIVSRRLKHDDWPTPDLIIIDGGKAQLNAALSVFGPHPVWSIVALAKREEELYLPDGRIIKLKEGPEPLLHLLTSIRDEAHRFAVSYHRKLRSKTLF